MSGIRYSENVSFVDYLIGSHDELDVERELLEMRSSPDSVSELAMAEYQSAIDRIDHLKVSGEYEAERRRIGQAVTAASDAAQRRFADRNRGTWVQRYLDGDKEARDRLDAVENLYAGVRSPDPDQQRRFRAFFDEIKNKAPWEVRATLAVLERGKGRKGRRALRTPWAGEQENMDRVRLLVSQGISVAGAARQVADAEGRVDADERAKTIARLFRMKMALRKKISAI